MPTAEAAQKVHRLLPKTPRQLAARIAEQRAVVVYLRDQVDSAEDPLARAVLVREMQQAAGVLARLLAGAASRLQRADDGSVGLERLDAATARARAQVIYREAAAIKQVLRDLEQRFGKGDAVAKHRAQVQHRLLSARFRLLGRRFKLLQRGQDIEQYTQLAPGSVPPRRELGLPLVYSVPGPGETTILVRAVAAGLRRRPGESDRTFRMRLKAYATRALVRFLNKRHSQQLPVDAAIEDAVKDTFEQDGAVLEAEVAAGGVAADPVADTMISILDEVNDEIARVAEDMQPEVPEGLVAAEDVDQIVAEADQVEVALTEAGEDMYDDVYSGSAAVRPTTTSGGSVPAFRSSASSVSPAGTTTTTTTTAVRPAITSSGAVGSKIPTVRRSVTAPQAASQVQSLAPVSFLPSPASSSAGYEAAAMTTEYAPGDAAVPESGPSRMTYVLIGVGCIGVAVGAAYFLTRKKRN